MDKDRGGVEWCEVKRENGVCLTKRFIRNKK